jgi:RNA recognition motif-containing protein
MNIYVGNLFREVSDSDLKTVFEAYGQVSSANVIKDKFTGESRGFGFVEMPEKAEADAAIEHLNGTDMKGQAISVNEARPKTTRTSGNRQGGNRFGRDNRRSSGGGRQGGERRYR